MRYSVFSGGKRIRPVITIESSAACGGRLKDAVVAACAVELVHTYSLIHDDLPAMDDDDYRRGKPSCHKSFGEANAILAGDALLTLAFNLLAEKLKPVPAARSIAALSRAAGTFGMVGGQADDLETKSRKIEKKIFHRVNYLKTARLFEVSALLGAVVSGAGDEKERAMSKYGMNLGMAFQIIDDTIDRDGYYGIVGRKDSVEEAGIFIEKAVSALTVFGNRQNKLAGIARSISGRAR
jgi:geranylgeranyl diphosphate synthase type II